MAKTETFDQLKALTQELIKEKPNQTRVKKLMLEIGLPYTTDSIQQMNSVLGLMSSYSFDSKKRKTKEKAPEL